VRYIQGKDYRNPNPTCLFTAEAGKCSLKKNRNIKKLQQNKIRCLYLIDVSRNWKDKTRKIRKRKAWLYSVIISIVNEG
jgi:hypothetical protein